MDVAEPAGAGGLREPQAVPAPAGVDHSGDPEPGGAEGTAEPAGAGGMAEPSGADDTGEAAGAVGTGEAAGADDTGEAAGAEGTGEAAGSVGTGEAAGADDTGEAAGAEGAAEPAGAEGRAAPGGTEGAVQLGGAEGTAQSGGAEATGLPAGAEGSAEPGGAEGTGAAEDDLVELALASVELSAEGLQPATGTVSLVDMAGGGRVDIVMARADAVLVQDAIADIAPPRPRTHDLLLAAVAALEGRVTGVTLVERRPGGIYVASLRVRRPDGSSVELDARPSDALNVALRSAGTVLRAPRALIDVPAN